MVIRETVAPQIHAPQTSARSTDMRPVLTRCFGFVVSRSGARPAPPFGGCLQSYARQP